MPMKEDFIPGIDNYCDRWCERCAFTARCNNFKNSQSPTADEVDINNTALWEHITDNFQKTIQLLSKTAEEYGVSLDKAMATEDENKYEQQRTALKIATKNHGLSKLCNEYQQVVAPFVKKDKLVNDKIQELAQYVRLGIKTEKEVKAITVTINDCFDIIQWYLFFIGAKLQRALNGKLEGESRGIDNRFQKDGEGSAKVTIIAVEKSMMAWTQLYELMPVIEDEALPALSLLSRLRKKILDEFPQAMFFKRPGFDD
jgi:hypothetical protein